MIAKAPLRFKPYLKQVIWGGDKICAFKGIEQPAPNIGESWEISSVPGHESVVDGGEYDGLTINDLIKAYGPSLLGEKIYEHYGGRFPLLVKLIDANENISVQVHPDDTLAMKRHGCLGKTEMWYIIDAERDARIYAGLNIKLTPEEYESWVEGNGLMEALAVHDSKPGDVFLLPAGCVHAIGAGNLLAEIQASSDITYRIYDYGRRDRDGNLRELHTELAKDAIDFNAFPSFRSHPEDSSASSHTTSPLLSCDHFKTFELNLESNMAMDLAHDSFTIIMCIQGSAVLKYPSGSMKIHKGETLLLPAILTSISLSGQARLLLSHP